ncbi:glycosyltransferase [Clostridium saudiense]|uniref:glycosyltransferase n=1 Tax=Clostridium saudiense TaxID=1414720 RepID=UPI0018AC177C|nr:glycosyltransferase [Clostridium saudiense]
MRILLLINWKIEYCDSIPKDKQPSDYCCPQEKFWFLKYFKQDVNVDVIDISAPKWIEKFEKKVRFHFYQTIQILKNINKYDMILIHGSDSAMMLGALKRILPIKTPPIVVVDISSFHQADESGIIHKLCQFSSKSFDHLIYHTSSQIDYYKKHFKWLVDKSTFIRVGVDYDYWRKKKYKIIDERNSYIICVGYRKRDWDTLVRAYEQSGIKKKLYLIGNPSLSYDNKNIKVLPFIPIESLMEYIYNSALSIIPLDDFNYSFAQLTILQQMILGTNIIAADVPALRDYIKCSKGVTTYKPYDAEDLSKKMVEVLSKSYDEIESMREANCIAIRDILSEKNMSRDFEKVCERVLKK